MMETIDAPEGDAECEVVGTQDKNEVSRSEAKGTSIHPRRQSKRRKLKSVFKLFGQVCFCIVLDCHGPYFWCHGRN